MPRCNFCDPLLDLTRRERAPQGSAAGATAMGMASACPACGAALNFGLCTPPIRREVMREIAGWPPALRRADEEARGSLINRQEPARAVVAIDGAPAERVQENGHPPGR